MRRITPLGTVMIAVAALTMVGVGGTMAVQATTSNPAYRACANSHRVLTLLSHGRCASGHAVSLGARGPAGPRGPVGPSRVIAGQTSSSPDFQADATLEVLATVRHVPQGSWLVTGTASIYGVSGVDIQCWFDPVPGTAVVNQGADDDIPVDNGLTPDGKITITATALIRLPATSNVSLSCRGQDPNPTNFWTVFTSNVTAERVGSIKTTNGAP